MKHTQQSHRGFSRFIWLKVLFKITHNRSSDEFHHATTEFCMNFIMQQPKIYLITWNGKSFCRKLLFDSPTLERIIRISSRKLYNAKKIKKSKDLRKLLLTSRIKQKAKNILSNNQYSKFFWNIYYFSKLIGNSDWPDVFIGIIFCTASPWCIESFSKSPNKYVEKRATGSAWIA